jgi:hypothetical protein
VRRSYDTTHESPEPLSRGSRPVRGAEPRPTCKHVDEGFERA